MIIEILCCTQFTLIGDIIALLSFVTLPAISPAGVGTALQIGAMDAVG